MGLDSVELVLTAEEEFGISIDDADAASLTTPRLLAEYVASRLAVKDKATPVCPSQAAFHRLRTVLIEQFGATRNEVLPESNIAHWLQGDIKPQWDKLKLSCGMTHAPALVCKKSIYYPMTLGLPVLTLSLMLANGIPIWASLLLLLATWIVANIAAGHMADEIPPAVRTIRGLIPYVQARQKEHWTPDYVLQRVIQITSQQLGIPITKIHPDDHFVKDLGID